MTTASAGIIAFSPASPPRPEPDEPDERLEERRLHTSPLRGVKIIVDSRAWKPIHEVTAWARRWPLWGVLLTGICNALLYEHGDFLARHTSHHFFIFLLAMPLIGGLVTPTRPAYTLVVFAVGSVPPVYDMPPIPIIVWPFACGFYLLVNHANLKYWPDVLIGVLIFMAATATCLAVICIIFTPPVYIGWTIRRRYLRWVMSRNNSENNACDTQHQSPSLPVQKLRTVEQTLRAGGAAKTSSTVSA